MFHITAAKLYYYTLCPHRVWSDIQGPEDEIKDGFLDGF